MFQKNDYVYWQASVKGIIYDRAGRVEFVVPAFKHPKEYVPDTFNFYGVGKPRDTVSFLISVPGTNTLFWPNIEKIQSLGLNQWHILYDQRLKVRSRSRFNVDKTDRLKLRNLCELVCLLFNDAYYENEDFITVPGWGKRFWFGLREGKEYIKYVEDFIPVKGV